MAPRGELTWLLRNFLQRRDFDARALKLPLLDIPPVWSQPPAFTDSVMDGVPLQPHVAVRCELGLDELVDVYERFLYEWVRPRRPRNTDTNCWQWLHRSLGLSWPQLRSLFVPPQEGSKRLGYHLNLVQFALLVAYNFDVSVEEDATSYCVTVRTYRFGVSQGHLVSNLGHTAPMPVRFLEDPAGLSLMNIARQGLGADSGDAMFEIVMAWGARLPPEDRQALTLVLRILWWRRNGLFPYSLKALTLPSNSRQALRSAVTAAREFRDLHNPYEFVRSLLVPQHMPRKEFNYAFPTKKGVVTPHLALQWDQALNELDLGAGDAD